MVLAEIWQRSNVSVYFESDFDESIWHSCSTVDFLIGLLKSVRYIELSDWLQFSSIDSRIALSFVEVAALPESIKCFNRPANSFSSRLRSAWYLLLSPNVTFESTREWGLISWPRCRLTLLPFA